MTTIDFFFGTGSRYSYLAAMRVPALEAQTGATVCWRAVYSPELLARAGNDAFSAPSAAGQYAPEYRHRDLTRWAALFGLPYREPAARDTDWRRLALWAVAAELVGEAGPFAAALMRRSFGEGNPPGGDGELRAMAEAAGLPGGEMARLVEEGEAEAAHERNLAAALAAGAFGVPSFVTPDGELFFGQDRMVLIAHHLAAKAAIRP